MNLRRRCQRPGDDFDSVTAPYWPMGIFDPILPVANGSYAEL
jgi:hypothetical protein